MIFVIQTFNFFLKLCHNHCYEVLAFIYVASSNNLGTSRTTFFFKGLNFFLILIFYFFFL